MNASTATHDRLPPPWHGQRLAVIGFAALVVLCALWTVYGRDELLSIIATCRAEGAACSPTRLAELTFGSDGRLRLLGTVSIALPALAGAFWGAPLISRVLETGHGQLPASPRGRVHWYLTRFALAAAGTTVAAALLALLVVWWWQPAANKAHGLPWYDPAILHATGPATLAAALFGLAAGTAAGLLLRRTLPAMITTVACVLVVRWTLHASHRVVFSPSVFTAEGTTAPPMPEGAWWSGWGFLTRTGGQAPASACAPEADMAECMSRHGFTGTFVRAYPPGRLLDLPMVRYGHPARSGRRRYGSRGMAASPPRALCTPRPPA